MSGKRNELERARRLVIKLGSSLLTRPDLTLNTEYIEQVGAQLRQLHAANKEIVLVTSGAVAAGLPKLGWASRPTALTDLHVAAAVGQLDLLAAYQRILNDQPRPAQILVTAAELSQRHTYLDTRATLRRLFELKILPVVNENDAIAIHESRFGDNDRLAALLANLVEADILIIATDVDGLYRDADITKGGELVAEALAGDPTLKRHIGTRPAGRIGSGGMHGKLTAAMIAARGSIHTVIANGNQEDVLLRLASGEKLGTFLRAQGTRMQARKRWLADGTAGRGMLQLDPGAVDALCRHGRSLLPIGVRRVHGPFARGDVVECVGTNENLIARGLVNYDSREASLIVQTHSEKIAIKLGYVLEEEMIHRDNMVILNGP